MSAASSKPAQPDQEETLNSSDKKKTSKKRASEDSFKNSDDDNLTKCKKRVKANSQKEDEKLNIRQIMTMNLREMLNKKKILIPASKAKKSTETDEKKFDDSTDAFPFLRQTFSGRVVKRTELTSMKEFWVARPSRAKSTSPKQMHETVVTSKSSKSTRRNSTGNLNSVKQELKFSPEKPQEEASNNINGDCSPTIDQPVEESPKPKIEPDCIEEKTEDVEMSIDENAQNSLLRIKLDHDYDKKKPIFPMTFPEDKESNEELVTTIENINIKQEVESKEENNDVEKSPESSKKEVNENASKKEDSSRIRKKTRLSSEVRTLIDESIKATKTLNISTSRLRKPRPKLRNKQRRTECEMLLDMLSENPGPDNLIRIKGRSVVKPIVNGSPTVKTISKPNTKVQKVNLLATKGKDDTAINSDANDSGGSPEFQVKLRAKKPVTPLVAKKKNKAIQMKLKLLKKKKTRLVKDETVVHLPTSSIKKVEPSECNTSKIDKTIVLQDLKEKMKAKMEKSGVSNVKKASGWKVAKVQFPLSYYPTLGDGNEWNLRRPPGRPRVHHNPQLPKPAKVSRHGKILGRPKKNSGIDGEKSLLSSGSAKLLSNINTITTTSNQSLIDSSSFVLQVPVLSLGSNPTLQNKYLLQSNSVVCKGEVNPTEKSSETDFKDYSRQRSSQRQAESTHKYKEIAVKLHKDFGEIIFLPQSNPKSGLTPQVFKELKTALVTTGKDSNCKVILLHGSGNVFCSGVDLAYLLKDGKEQRQKAATEMVSAMREFLRSLISYPKPVVVAVNGSATGLGVGLLLLCDIVYASDKATFELPYSQLGHVPEGCVSVTLPKNMSMTVVNDLLLMGRRLTATEAQQYGLISQVFWPNNLLEEVVPRVQKLASQNGHVMETTKALLRQKTKATLEATLENECQLLLNQWCQMECQRSMKSFLNT